MPPAHVSEAAEAWEVREEEPPPALRAALGPGRTLVPQAQMKTKRVSGVGMKELGTG